MNKKLLFCSMFSLTLVPIYALEVIHEEEQEQRKDEKGKTEETKEQKEQDETIRQKQEEDRKKQEQDRNKKNFEEYNQAQIDEDNALELFYEAIKTVNNPLSDKNKAIKDLEQARKIYNDAKDKVNAAAQKQPKRKRSQQLQTIEEETQLNDIIAQALVATPKDQPTILNDNGTLKFSAEELKFYVMEPKKQKMLQAALEQSPQLLVQMIHEPDLRTFIESNAQKNPELWLTALIKARDEKLSVADQQSVEKLQNTTIDIIMKHMIESADKNKAGIMQNALIQFLELTKNSPSQRANQIKIIESFSKKGFTDATALATAMVVSRFTRTLDFNRLDTNQRAILMDAATKMMQKETAPQPWYGLLMLDKIMSNSPEQVTIDQTLSNTIQKKFTEALEKKVTLGNINLGKFFINEIASIATYNNAIISLFEALLKIATAKKQDIFTSADITQLKSFLKIRKDALQKKLPIKQTDKTPKNTSTIPEEETGMTQQQKDEKEAELIKIMMHGGQLL